MHGLQYLGRQCSTRSTLRQISIRSMVRSILHFELNLLLHVYILKDKRNNKIKLLYAYNVIQVGSLNDVISWKHYVSVLLQQVRPIYQLRTSAGMRVNSLTPSNKLLKYDQLKANFYQNLNCWVQNSCNSMWIHEMFS